VIVAVALLEVAIISCILPERVDTLAHIAVVLDILPRLRLHWDSVGIAHPPNNRVVIITNHGVKVRMPSWDWMRMEVMIMGQMVISPNQ
jgi:hypothetical protein